MKIIVRGFGLLLWLTAVGLTIALVIEFSAEGSNGVALGIAGLAIAISSIGLVFARYAWQRRAYPEIALGIAMWLAGFVCLAFIEVSYWVSSYEERFAQYNEQKTSKQRHDAKSEKDWKALLTGEVPATAAQIEAEIRGKRLDAAVTRSANCTDVTRDDSRKVCRELAALEAKLAAAQKREQMETSVVAGVGAKVASSHIANNVFAFAEVMAELRGGTVKDWSYVIMLWNWILLTLVRDAGALVANPLGRRRDAATLPQEPRKADPVSDALQAQVDALTRVAEVLKAAEKVTPAPRAPLPVTLGKLTGTVSKVENVNPQEKPVSSNGAFILAYEDGSQKVIPNSKTNPDPDGTDGGTRDQVPEPVENFDTQEAGIAAKAENVYDFPRKTPAEEHQEAKATRAAKVEAEARKKKTKTGEGWEAPIIRSWLGECCSELPQQIGIVDKDAPGITKVFESFEAWRIIRDEREIHKKRFSTVLAGLRNMPPSKGKDGHRGKGGRKFDWLRVYEPQVAKRRAAG